MWPAQFMSKLDTIKCVNDYSRWSTWHNNVRKKSSTLWDNIESTARSNCRMGGKNQRGSGCGQYIIADPTTDTLRSRVKACEGTEGIISLMLSLGSSEWSSSRAGCFASPPPPPSKEWRASRVHPHSHPDDWKNSIFLLPESRSIVYKYLYNTPADQRNSD
jgi:hypothetical protein